MENNAPQFAKTLSDLIKKKNISQNQISKDTGVHASIVSRMCSDGVGHHRHVLKILMYLNVPDFEAHRIISERFAELDNESKKIWLAYKRDIPNDLEYLEELSPCEAWRVFACAKKGIEINKVKHLAKSCNIDIKNLDRATPWDFLEFSRKFAETFGIEAAKEILDRTPKEKYEPVILLGFDELHEADKFVQINSGYGNVNFDIPHVVLTNYFFTKGGEISCRPHKYGVEYVYSVRGTFALTYNNREYKLPLTERRSLYIFDAKAEHKIKLVDGEEGILLIIRYCPTKRDLKPKSE